MSQTLEKQESQGSPRRLSLRNAFEKSPEAATYQDMRTLSPRSYVAKANAFRIHRYKKSRNYNRKMGNPSPPYPLLLGDPSPIRISQTRRNLNIAALPITSGPLRTLSATRSPVKYNRRAATRAILRPLRSHSVGGKRKTAKKNRK
jgi:hypothetical protein